MTRRSYFLIVTLAVIVGLLAALLLWPDESSAPEDQPLGTPTTLLTPY